MAINLSIAIAVMLNKEAVQEMKYDKCRTRIEVIPNVIFIPSLTCKTNDIGVTTRPTIRSASARLPTKDMKGFLSSPYGSLTIANTIKRLPDTMTKKNANDKLAVMKESSVGAFVVVQFPSVEFVTFSPLMVEALWLY